MKLPIYHLINFSHTQYIEIKERAPVRKNETNELKTIHILHIVRKCTVTIFHSRHYSHLCKWGGDFGN